MVTYFMPIVLRNGLKQNQTEQIKDYVDNALKYGIFLIKSFWIDDIYIKNQKKYQFIEYWY